MRLILATSVIFQHSHLAGVDSFTWIVKIPAVPLFILISGLLVTESYVNSPSIKAYILKRIRRIVPGYVAVVLPGGALVWVVSKLVSMPANG